MVVAAAVWLVPYLMQLQSPVPETPAKPSLTAIATLKPEKPDVRAPNLSQLRSVKRPSMPAKPRLKPVKPQSQFKLENELLEEKDHAYS